jgi:hypothetical protein
MSPYASAAATVPVREHDQGTSVGSPQLQRVVGFEESRWLPSLLSDLRSLETTGRDIPGIGDFRVSQATADHMRLLLTAISGAPLPQPTLAPFSGGGVALVCRLGNRELTFTAYPDHNDFVFDRTDDNSEPAADGILTLQQPDRLRDVITAFLANPAR